MNVLSIPVHRPALRIAAGLAAATMALGIGAAGAAQAAAAATKPAQTAPGLASTPVPIKVGPDWSGNAQNGSSAPAWFTDSFGIVHLQGAATQKVHTGPKANLLGTLPAAARPARNVFQIVHTFLGTYADLKIATNGNITVINPHKPAVTDYTFVSLESITYRPSLAGSAPIALGADWAGDLRRGTSAPSWFADGSGIIHLQGAATQTSTAGNQNLLGTLPAGARPARNVFDILATNAGTYADVEIDTNGNINLIDPYGFAAKDYSFVSLEGISYSPGAIFNSLAPPFSGLNTANWSVPTVYGNSDPGWNEDNAGVVHLQGAATLTSLSGNFRLLATLPAIIRPSRTVYTIVHTFEGTYADLAIQPNGQVQLIDPRSPMGNGDTFDYTFVSLEGVTYHP
jgi:hypothetical protein